MSFMNGAKSKALEVSKHPIIKNLVQVLNYKQDSVWQGCEPVRLDCAIIPSVHSIFFLPNAVISWLERIRLHAKQ